MKEGTYSTFSSLLGLTCPVPSVGTESKTRFGVPKHRLRNLPCISQEIFGYQLWQFLDLLSAFGHRVNASFVVSFSHKKITGLTGLHL